MKKDVLAHMEALTTQASNTDSATAHEGAPPTVETATVDATLAASSGVNEGQETMGPREGNVTDKMSDFSLYPSAEAEPSSPQEAPIHTTLQEANSRRNMGKKNSRKRRNRKEDKIVYLPWPLTLQTRASSAAPVLGHTCVTEPFPGDNIEITVGNETREQRSDDEKEKTSILTQSCKAPAVAPLPAASPVPPSLEEGPLAANEEIKVGQKNRRKERNKKNKSIMASPWPLTVQAWASYTGLGQLPTAPAGAAAFANDGVNVGLRSKAQKDEKDKTSVVTYPSAQADGPGSCVAPGQISLEEASLANEGENIGKKSRPKRRNRKDKGVMSCPWPLTVQAWASFATTDPVQTFLQGKSSTAYSGVSMGPQLASCKQETKAILPWCVMVQAAAPCSATAPGQPSLEGAPALENTHSKLSQSRRRIQRGDEDQVQSSVEKSLESSQGWRNAKRYLGDQDFWECTVMNVARQVNCCYCGELCCQERVEALTLTEAHTHINTSVVEMQGQDGESAEPQDVWVEKWEGF
ncbi:hypothetical protein CB1_000612004 [Camelus ferus]|nr:hypothetical protein CB1_000612004 [Camelus ferus]